MLYITCCLFFYRQFEDDGKDGISFWSGTVPKLIVPYDQGKLGSRYGIRRTGEGKENVDQIWSEFYASISTMKAR